ncbi:MAG: cation transporter [Chloroflexi bacterium]|nr:cation transporter [Chloroflexota bacterium]
MSPDGKTEIDRLFKKGLRQRALLLVWIGELWNVGEFGVALWAGITADSVALIAFSLDSLVELFAGAVLIWHLRREWKQQEEGAAERKALKLVGITFFVLSAYILVQAVASLLGWFAEPRESLVGIVLVVASAVLMTILYFGKTNIAKKLGSRALRAEATESLVCDLQDLTLLVGLGANALWGWWWADPVAALALIPWLLKEGWEGWHETGEEAD